MNNVEIILILLMAGGFGLVISKLNRAIDLASLSISMQMGKVMGEKVDEDTFAIYMKDRENEEDE